MTLTTQTKASTGVSVSAPRRRRRRRPKNKSSLLDYASHVSPALCLSVCLCVCQCLYWINGINGLMLSTACMSSSASQTYSQTSRPLTMLLHIANNLATYLCNLFTLPAGLSQLSENYVKQFDVLKRVLALRFLSQCVGLCSTPTSTVYRLYIDARPEHNSPGRLIIECTVVTLC